MNVLVVGAGAVGQVYARSLALGGARVTFYVKPKYKAELEGGVVMYPLNGRAGPVRFDAFDVVTSAAEVRERRIEQIWLCVASPALEGSWLEELTQAAPKAFVITLQPGIEDQKRLRERVDEQRLVSGLITMISWQAPLPGEKLEAPGVMYWFPPLAPSPFQGPREATRAIVQTLKRGGCPAKESRSVGSQAAAGEALLQPLIMALEAAHWSTRELGGGPMLDLAVQGARESLAVAERFHGTRLPRAVWGVARRSALRLVVWAAPRLVPFNLEVYLKYHFSKVGRQTRQILASYIRLADSFALPHAALDEMQRLLGSSVAEPAQLKAGPT